MEYEVGQSLSLIVHTFAVLLNLVRGWTDVQPASPAMLQRSCWGLATTSTSHKIKWCWSNKGCWKGPCTRALHLACKCQGKELCCATQSCVHQNKRNKKCVALGEERFMWSRGVTQVITNKYSFCTCLTSLKKLWEWSGAEVYYFSNSGKTWSIVFCVLRGLLCWLKLYYSNRMHNCSSIGT